MPFNPKHSSYTNRVSLSFLVGMVIFAIITSSGGITYALFTNQQVLVRTDISQIKSQVSACTLNTSQLQAKTDSMTNRWVMRDRLIADHSTLRNIDRSQIELARRLHDSGVAVISR